MHWATKSVPATFSKTSIICYWEADSYDDMQLITVPRVETRCLTFINATPTLTYRGNIK